MSRKTGLSSATRICIAGRSVKEGESIEATDYNPSYQSSTSQGRLYATERGCVADAYVLVIVVRTGELLLEDALPTRVLLAVSALPAVAASGGTAGSGGAGWLRRVHARGWGRRGISRCNRDLEIRRRAGRSFPGQ